MEQRKRIDLRKLTALAVASGAIAMTGGCASMGGQDYEVLDDDVANLSYRNMTVDQIEDLRVLRNGRVVGEIEAVLGNGDGDIAAVVAELNAGPSPQAGGTEIVVPIESLRFQNAGLVEIALSDVELAALRRWQQD